VDSNLTIGLYCHDCAGSSQPTAFSSFQQNYTDWNGSWLGFALDSFDAAFEMEIQLDGTVDGSVGLMLRNYTVQDYGVTVKVEFEVYLAATASASVNFTAGVDFSVSLLLSGISIPRV